MGKRVTGPLLTFVTNCPHQIAAKYVDFSMNLQHFLARYTTEVPRTTTRSILWGTQFIIIIKNICKAPKSKLVTKRQSLPRDITSTATFKRHLKTHLLVTFYLF